MFKQLYDIFLNLMRFFNTEEINFAQSPTVRPLPHPHQEIASILLKNLCLLLATLYMLYLIWDSNKIFDLSKLFEKSGNVTQNTVWLFQNTGAYILLCRILGEFLEEFTRSLQADLAPLLPQGAQQTVLVFSRPLESAFRFLNLNPRSEDQHFPQQPLVNGANARLSPPTSSARPPRSKYSTPAA